jgi:biopolymer transport protein ExbB
MINKHLVKPFLVTFALLFTNSLFSQEIQQLEDGTKKMVGVEEITAFDFILKGGVFLIPIAILLFYTIYLGVEKYIYIRRTTKLDKNLVDSVKSNIMSGDVNTALSKANGNQTAFGKMIVEGIETIGRPISEIESNMEKVTNIEISKMEKNLGHLGLIAGIAPTLGFIGTISGVIKIFYNISISENVSIGNISGGLYEKMISSGAGLIVGIIAYSFYHILNGKIDNFVLNAQETSLKFIHFIKKPSNGDQTK